MSYVVNYTLVDFTFQNLFLVPKKKLGRIGRPCEFFNFRRRRRKEDEEWEEEVEEEGGGGGF